MNKEKNSLFLFANCSLFYCISRLHPVLTTLWTSLLFFTSLQMAECLTFYFLSFLVFFLPHSSHQITINANYLLWLYFNQNSHWPNDLTCFFSLFFSSACPTLFAHFSLKEVRLLTSYGRQKWHAHWMSSWQVMWAGLWCSAPRARLVVRLRDIRIWKCSTYHKF